MIAHYSPPYDSPIEDVFAYNVVKYLAEDCPLETQVTVDTLCGRFVIDFVVFGPSGEKIGIECDGKEFHDESRDEWRDAMILGDGYVNAMYRIRGSDINYHLDDVLFLISRLDSWAFSVRGAVNLERLASDNVVARDLSMNTETQFFLYGNDDGNGMLRMEVRRKDIPTGQRRFWKTAYDYARSIGGGQLDGVIAAYDEYLKESSDINGW